MDGEWEAPQIPNPKCETAPGCGEWVRPMMTNPNYKGKWKPPMIDNPNYQVVMKYNNKILYSSFKGSEIHRTICLGFYTIFITMYLNHEYMALITFDFRCFTVSSLLLNLLLLYFKYA